MGTQHATSSNAPPASFQNHREDSRLAAQWARNSGGLAHPGDLEAPESQRWGR
jgi:hypothetical protein